MKTIRKLFIVLAVALFAIASVEAQNPRYQSVWQKNRILQPVLLNTWQIGDGDAADTTLFATTTEYGTFYYTGDNPFEVETLAIGLQSGIGDDTLGVHVCWSDTIADATPSYLNTTAYAVSTATTDVEYTGVEDTSFDDSDIPVGSFVWVKLTDVTNGRKPIELVISLYGHVQDERGQ